MATINRTTLDDRNVKALKPQAKSYYAMDAKVIGFGVRVTSNGVKTFILRYRFHGRQRWHKIGFFGDDTVISAREYARDLKSRIRLGEDPEKERTDNRQIPTLREVCERYLSEKLIHAKNKLFYKDVKSMFESYLYPALGNRIVADITKYDLEREHKKLSMRGVFRSNRTFQSLRAAYNWNNCLKWLDDNPFKHFNWNKEPPRHHYLSGSEIKRLIEALEAHPQKKSAYAIKLILYTGARLNEILRATWQQFNFEHKLWVKPASMNKSGRQVNVPISDAMVRILQEMKAEPWHDDVFLFPAEDGKTLASVKKTWRTVRKNAKLVTADVDKGVRIHDLRHTVASEIINKGYSSSIVTSGLGHHDHSTAHRYIHVNDNITRSAMNDIGRYIDDQIRLSGE